MKSYLCLALSLLCFGCGAAIVYELIAQPDGIAFVDILQDAAGLTSQALRSAAFFLLGVDLILGVVLLALFFTSRKGEAKLQGFLQKCEEEREEAPRVSAPANFGIKETARSAFTLIELLVVIAIIAILAALLLVGVMAIFGKGPEAATRNDLLQLSHALEKFKTEYGFYPPSKFKLCKSYSEYGNTPLDTQSRSVLSTMYKSIGNFSNIAWTASGPGNATFKGGVPSLPVGGVILEGDQCLVFFLGGPPNLDGQPGLLGGFSTNPLDPAYRPYIFPIGTQPYPAGHPDLGRKRYYDFDTGRLFHRGGSPFPSYLDQHDRNHGKKTPFVYFSAYKRPNGYSPFGSSDNASLGISPYIESTAPTTKFFKSESFQLFSAGPDGVFGPGGAVAPGAATGGGKDDVCNFYDRGLGS